MTLPNTGGCSRWNPVLHAHLLPAGTHGLERGMADHIGDGAAGQLVALGQQLKVHIRIQMLRGQHLLPQAQALLGVGHGEIDHGLKAT